LKVTRVKTLLFFLNNISFWRCKHEKIIYALFSFVLLAGVAGCASPKMNMSIPISSDIKAEQDKAIVYFIRPSSLGFKVHAAVYDDEKFIGIMPYNQKLPYLAKPGEHLFMVVSEAADFLKADLLPGKTYYIKVMPRMGAWRARFSLAPVTKVDYANPEIQKWIKDARLIQNNDDAYKWAKENHPSVLNKKKAYFEKWVSKPENDRPFLKQTDYE
jgi:hypothetical protein